MLKSKHSIDRIVFKIYFWVVVVILVCAPLVDVMHCEVVLLVSVVLVFIAAGCGIVSGDGLFSWLSAFAFQYHWAKNGVTEEK